jgi:hypothetical protein
VCKAEKITITIFVIFLAWVLLSFIDINAHNLTDQQYHQFNFFKMLTQI